MLEKWIGFDGDYLILCTVEIPQQTSQLETGLKGIPPPSFSAVAQPVPVDEIPWGNGMGWS
jgi:hypothetical protein